MSGGSKRVVFGVTLFVVAVAACLLVLIAFMIYAFTQAEEIAPFIYDL
jgi:hypothetical protein